VIQIYQQDTKVTGMTHRTLPVDTEDTRARFLGTHAMNRTCAVFFPGVEPFTVGDRHIEATAT